jgi:Lrp/AsnC family transcriptional regulator for asnA, asnC and gidA
MKHALVLFNVESGAENQVLKTVKKIDGVIEAYISYGVYDIVVKISADYMDELKKIISDNLRQIKKVRSTISLILIEE